MDDNKTSGENTDKLQQDSDNKLRFSFLKIMTSLLDYFKLVVNIKDEVDYEGSVEAIKKDIDFKGVNVWVLGASIVIASIGLNVNSTAVIIGAMLISPLMGPIVGMGLAVGINDFKMLTRSLRGLGTAVLISFVISTLYFLITPFGDVQSELIARTRPNLLDVLVAIFSGIALIVAKTQKSTVASAIYGVAIATALMPPLCTAGYGLANGNWVFFLGAFYLFLINSVFITLSTWLVVKYLKFPTTTYMNPKREKKVNRYILFFSIIIILPSAFTFWDSIQENLYKKNAELFIAENFDFEGSKVINKKIMYKEDGNLSSIEVFLIGETISEEQQQAITAKLEKYSLKETDLVILQSNNNSGELVDKLGKEVKSGIIEELYRKNDELIENKDKKINFLEHQLKILGVDAVPFNSLKKEIKLQYNDVENMSYGKTISTDFTEKQDTVSTFLINWNKKLSDKEIREKNTLLQTWLRVRLEDDKLRVINY
ncbi:MAG: DUF389 domain-containing protein [Bacteroidetes bacterium]|nr:DUF389 domain-containing protein [Bacteroidota bacterium]